MSQISPLLMRGVLVRGLSARGGCGPGPTGPRPPVAPPPGRRRGSRGRSRSRRRWRARSRVLRRVALARGLPGWMGDIAGRPPDAKEPVPRGNHASYIAGARHRRGSGSPCPLISSLSVSLQAQQGSGPFAPPRLGGPMISRALSALRLLVLLLLAMVALLPATAGAATFPDTIRLPDGWQPEGIAAGRGTSLYVGSIPTGAIWKGDARTGRGDVLVGASPAAPPSASRSTGATGCWWPAVLPGWRSSTTPGPARTWPATGSPPRAPPPPSSTTWP